MKRLLYNIVFCCMAVLSFTACNKDDSFGDTGAGAGGNSIILDFASGSLPVSRTEATGAEIAVSHLDVLIFDEDGKKAWHERVNVGQNGGGNKVTLSAKRSGFAQDTQYWVYLIANSTEPVTTFQADDFTLNKLKGLKQIDDQIHMTGLKSESIELPQTFLMDGVAYNGDTEPKPGSTVVLFDGDKSANTELKVTLRRAAAKIVVTMHKGEKVAFANGQEDYANMGYYLRNMPYSTSLLPATIDKDSDIKLRTTTKNNWDYFDWTEDVITVTAYAYQHVWENASALEKEVRLIVNIPMTYTANPEEEGQYMANSYYQIPISASKELKRNTCYKVDLTINAPGGSDPSEPIEVTGISYSVYDWETEQINISGNEDRPAYLTLNEYDMEMRNIADDNTTLEFASSSAVTPEITRVYYIDKFGQEVDLEKTNNLNKPDEWGENTGNDWYPDWKNECTIKITPDENITGKIHIHSTVPENNTIRYIEFKVKNEDNIERTVTVAQYPLTYIQNIEGLYSYRDDFVSTASDGTSGVTTWELLAGKKINKGQQYSSVQVPYNNDDAWICGCSWSSYNRWSYNKGSGNSDFFGSKIAEDFDDKTGLCSISYARWSESRTRYRPYRYTYDTKASGIDGLNNHRMYHVTITATSSEYTLGLPRITNGKTDPGEDNAVLVSPSFMLASQLGAVQSAGNVNIAASHCEQYVEVARDGTVYDDWRLPTRAEVEIIYKYQNDSDAMDEVLSGESYWSASPNKAISNPKPTASGTNRIRCIRDAYDTKTGK